VLLVDGHPLVRERLAELIATQPGLVVCGQAASRAETLALIPRVAPDVAVLEIALRDCHGLDLIKDIHAFWPHVGILVLSARDEAVFGERVLRAGASGFVSKQESSPTILHALRRVIAGELHLSDALAAAVATGALGHRRAAQRASVECLADRELEVFEMIGRLRSTEEIAAQLRLSVSTVETHRLRIKEKLQLKDAHALMRAAVHWVIVQGIALETFLVAFSPVPSPVPFAC
jgi:DNA-binding NarL/FixJ family response regulator